MMPLVKRDLLLNKYATVFLVVLAIPLIYFAGIPTIFYMWYLLFPALAINLFYYDDKFSLNRFLITLPVSKKTIVRSRYVYLLSLHVAVLLYTWAVSTLNISLSPGVDYLNYTWKEAVIVLSGFVILTAIVVPCYYAIRSFYAATIVIYILIFASFFFSVPLLAWRGLDMGNWISLNQLDQGYVPLLEQYISFQPYLMLILVAVVFLIVSMKVSEWVFTRQDH